MSQKLSVHGSESVKNTSQFRNDFIKNYNEDSNTRNCLEHQISKKIHKNHNDLPFYQKR